MNYPLIMKPERYHSEDEFSLFPMKKNWQVATVESGHLKETANCKGTTHIYFQANIWIATILIFLVGIVWGIGKAAVCVYTFQITSPMTLELLEEW